MIDQDFELNTESYNDRLSYRRPISWDANWDWASSGFRVSAGSLTMTRFYFVEDIKIDPISTNDLSIAFEQSRVEDSTEIEEARELRLGIRLIDQLRLLVLGDGSVDKEYGDIGVGARMFETEDQHLDFIYWSVDHYYNDKTHEPGATYLQPARTYELRGWRKIFSDSVSGSAKIESDLPFSWQRPESGIYSYWRNKVSGTLNLGSTADQFYFLTVENDEKFESWSSLDGLNQMRFKRRATFVELGKSWRPYSVDQAFRMSVFGVNRLSKWAYPEDEKTIKKRSLAVPPSSSDRKESGIDVRSESLLSPRSKFSQGVVANNVTILEGARRWRNLEVKYVTAVNWNFTPEAGFGLNATWDIDQITRDFPYQQAPFRPWGGGNIEAQMVF